jgi:hypothetical protein
MSNVIDFFQMIRSLHSIHSHVNNQPEHFRDPSNFIDTMVIAEHTCSSQKLYNRQPCDNDFGKQHMRDRCNKDTS